MRFKSRTLPGPTDWSYLWSYFVTAFHYQSLNAYYIHAMPSILIVTIRSHLGNFGHLLHFLYYFHTLIKYSVPSLISPSYILYYKVWHGLCMWGAGPQSVSLFCLSFSPFAFISLYNQQWLFKVYFHKFVPCSLWYCCEEFSTHTRTRSWSHAFKFQLKL